MPYQLSPLVKPRLYALSLSVTLGRVEKCCFNLHSGLLARFFSLFEIYKTFLNNKISTLCL